MLNKSLEARRAEYKKLGETLKQKGRIPFKKSYQKHSKLMMFIHDTLTEMTNDTKFQNREGILFRIKLPYAYTSRNVIGTNGKIIVEYAIRPGSARLQAFDVERMTTDEVLAMLNTFLEHYGLSLTEDEERFERFARNGRYIVRLPGKMEL